MLEEGLGDVSDGCGGDEGSVCKVLERILLFPHLSYEALGGEDSMKRLEIA